MAVQLHTNERGQRPRRRVWPNPSLKAPTHYGRQRKAGLWPSGIITVQPYAAHLRGRL
jgi:hypothetical protein